MPEEIKVGDRVRSFDFGSRDLVGARACYIEGVVEAIGPVEICPCKAGHYSIRVDRQIFGGVPRLELIGRLVYPPVNGSPSIFDADGTNGVQKVEVK